MCIAVDDVTEKDLDLLHKLLKIIPGENSMLGGLYWIRTSDPYSVKVML
jgi:hypothetical protein